MPKQEDRAASKAEIDQLTFLAGLAMAGLLAREVEPGTYLDGPECVAQRALAQAKSLAKLLNAQERK